MTSWWHNVLRNVSPVEWFRFLGFLPSPRIYHHWVVYNHRASSNHGEFNGGKMNGRERRSASISIYNNTDLVNGLVELRKANNNDNNSLSWAAQLALSKSLHFRPIQRISYLCYNNTFLTKKKQKYVFFQYYQNSADLCISTLKNAVACIELHRL